ncbi:ATP-binding protein [Saccharothrix lopnurensis]|uniref:ATP-binding protein n=1 Tax=Saccharothrix lopnurensis TaxID=1670621 RepID=A0ABW1P9S2_9PSEU
MTTDPRGWRSVGRPRLRTRYTRTPGGLGDVFGLSHEAAIVASRVREVFTPHQPIQPGEMLAGRQDEVRKLVEALNTPGQHSLLYGDRGVGKSSLANVVMHTAALATTSGYYTKRCDHTDTFETIFRKPLADAGLDVRRVEYTTQETDTRKKGVTVFDAGVEWERQSNLAATYRPGAVVGAADAAAHLARLRGYMLIDELDVVADPVARRKVAELIKHLSDAGAGFKLMLVGIAGTAADLTGAHPSVQRSLRETRLHRMPSDDLRRIVQAGGRALGLTFEDGVTAEIARLSAGYPHFTHLLALKCAENAISTERSTVGPDVLPLAMSTAVEDAEGTLRHAYAESTRSPSGAYRALLVAAAALDTDEFTTAQLRAAVGDPSAALRRLASDDGLTVLRRVTRGVYRFSDPRMRSYIRIIDPV